MAQKVTVWSNYVFDFIDKLYTGPFHHHIEDGWNTVDKVPHPIKTCYTYQNGWKSFKWKKEFGFLVNGKIRISGGL